MEFKNITSDDLTLTADLLLRAAGDRDPALAKALRRIEHVQCGRYGEGRPDLQVTIALGGGSEISIVMAWKQHPSCRMAVVEDAATMAEAIERVFDDRFETADMLKEVRTALNREVAKARRRGLPVRTVGLSLTPVEADSDDLPAVLVELEILGPLIDLTTVRFEAETADEIVEQCAAIQEKQVSRLVLRERLDEIGCDVIIDPPTLAVLEDAGVDPADAIAQLRDNKALPITVGVKHGNLVLYARDGVVTGNAPMGPGMRWQEGRLTVPKTDALCAVSALGRKLNDIVGGGYFEPGLVVDHATDDGDELRLNASPPPMAVRLADIAKAA